MELWIRSQHKEMLFKVNNSLIIRSISSDFSNECFIECDGQKIALYKSKARALEVLDEIQNILEPLLIVKNCTNKEEKQKASEMCNISDYIGTGNNCDIHLLSNTYVYQMPEE